MKRVYLSGPMTGIPDFNFPAFNAEAARLRALGYEVANPAEMNDSATPYNECLRNDLSALMTCDTVAMLDGWMNSNGAHLEMHIAHRVGMRIVMAREIGCESFDLVAHLRRQREFSLRTFGPGMRINGVTDHIAKELIEVRESGGDLREWIDVVILGLDGCWRSGATPEEIVAAIVAKQTKNEGRNWPDWRTVAPDTAIEHVREEAAA